MITSWQLPQSLKYSEIKICTRYTERIGNILPISIFDGPSALCGIFKLGYALPRL